MQISFNESRVFFSQTKHLSPFYRQLSELVQLLVFPLFYFLFSSIFFFGIQWIIHEARAQSCYNEMITWKSFVKTATRQSKLIKSLDRIILCKQHLEFRSTLRILFCHCYKCSTLIFAFHFHLKTVMSFWSQFQCSIFFSLFGISQLLEKFQHFLVYKENHYHLALQ